MVEPQAQAAQHAHDAAVRGDHRVAIDLAQPSGYALGQVAVALAARRAPAPFVGLARGEASRVPGGQLVPELALPVSVVDLAQPVVGAIALRRQAHLGAHQLYRLPRAQERARDMIEVGRLRSERNGQCFPVADGLLATQRIEGMSRCPW